VIAFVTSQVSDQVLTDLAKRVPLVRVMGGEAPRSQVDHVTVDNTGVGCLAHRYLASKGCERLAFIATNVDWLFIRHRAQSFANAAADAGQAVDFYLVSRDSNAAGVYGQHIHQVASLEDAVAALVRSNPRPTGLFIPTDLQTSQVHPLLVKHGLHPEKDIHLVSCDNEQVRLAALSPQPLSIELGGEDIGGAAVRQLMNRISEPEAPTVRVQVSPRLLNASGLTISINH
jgi:DNA-binding LacI/PurR family transcriptional regulator